MNTVLWVCQGLLATVFLFSGLSKSTQSKERMLATGQTGVREYRLGFIRVVALGELMGSCGLVLPWATGILPVLTPLAAFGLCIIMMGAARAHFRLREPRNVAINIALFTLAAFVGFGRMSAFSS